MSVCNNCTKPPLPGRSKCASCIEVQKRAYHRRREMGIIAGDYRPIDEVLESPPVRILRALRHFDGISCFDLFEIIGVPRHNGGTDALRDAHTQALCRLNKAGLIERMRFSGMLVRGEGFNWYRVTEAGRQWLAEQLKPDTKTIWTEKYVPRKSV
jgi:hypothetical protein